MFCRVLEYVASGREKDVVDPGQNLIYTRRKQRQEQSQTQSDLLPKESTVKFPSTGWSISLQRMPLFTKAEMDLHISQSGKNIDRNKQNHAVPTSMKKAKTFLEDEYLRDIVAASDNEYFFFKCLCHHSFKKNEAPHKLQVALCLVSGAVKYASCTCVAGSVGFCNHVLALMMKLCKFSLYSCQDVKELDYESDMTASKACTSSLQIWHRPVRGDKIKPQPVMELEVKRSKLDKEYNPDSGVRCLLYEARKNLSTQTSDEIMLKDKLQKINPKFALSQIMSPGGTNLQETKFGNTYEPVALKEYEKYMFSTRNPVTVFKSGLVVSMASPFLAASPDGKVIDHGCSKPFGLVEIKCPYSKFHVSPLDACEDESFFAENVNGVGSQD